MNVGKFCSKLFLQGIIKLWNNGEFYIANEGRRCIFVDGRPVSLCVWSFNMK